MVGVQGPPAGWQMDTSNDALVISTPKKKALVMKIKALTRGIRAAVEVFVAASGDETSRSTKRLGVFDLTRNQIRNHPYNNGPNQRVANPRRFVVNVVAFHFFFN